MNNRYHKYLQSDEWRAVRARIMKRARGKCEKCGKRPPIQVHHKAYARLGHERDDDLIAVCGPCHQSEHPDKPFLLSPSFVGEADYPMCPCETAEIFAGSREILTICTGCGHTAAKPRQGARPTPAERKPRKRVRKRQKPKLDPAVPHADRMAAQEARRVSEAIERGRKKLAEGKPKLPKKSPWAFSW
jgi:hypothetical protein